MKKRFIVSINKAVVEQEQEFIKFLESQNLDYWHWLSNLWLVIDLSGTFNAGKLRDEVNRIFPKEHNLIFELNQTFDNWAGFGPKSEERNMFSWLQEKWKK